MDRPFPRGAREVARVADFSLQLTGTIATQDPDFSARLAQLRESWPLGKGAAFRQADWDSAKHRAPEALLADRYPAARVAESEARVNPETREAFLKVVVDSGPPFTFGELEISGWPPASESGRAGEALWARSISTWLTGRM